MSYTNAQPMRLVGQLQQGKSSEWFEVILACFFSIPTTGHFGSFGVSAVSWVRLVAWLHGSWHIAHLF